MNKEALDTGKRGRFNGKWPKECLARTRKRDELAYERTQLKTRLAEVEAELKALDYALKVVSPAWEPSKRKPRAPARPRRLLRGQVATTCLQVLRKGGALSTPEIVQLVARHLERWPRESSSNTN